MRKKNDERAAMRQALLGIVGLLFIGCGPRYVIQNQYVPPLVTTEASTACFNGCMTARERCQTPCQTAYQRCLDDAYAKAKAIEVEEMRSFDRAYDRYMFELSSYRAERFAWESAYRDYSRDLSYFQSQCERTKDPSACQRRDELRSRVNALRYRQPREPWVPVRPSFEQILVNQQSFCTTDCGCDQAYDACFAGCGGQVIPHKICVENCD